MSKRDIFGKRMEQYGVESALARIKGLQVVEGQGMTAVEATRAVGADFTISKLPVGFQLGDQFVRTGDYALVRTFDEGTQPAPLGIVGDDYTPVQNLDIAEVFHQLQYPVWAAGAPKDGREFMLVFDVGRWDLGGDPIDDYLIVHAPQDGSGSVRAALTPVRVFCMNVLVHAMAKATFKVNIPHTRNIDERLVIARYILGQVEQARAATTEAFDALTRRVLVEDEIAAIVEAAWPYPDKPDTVRDFDHLLEAGQYDADDEDFHLFESHALAAKEAWSYRCERQDAFRAGAYQMISKVAEELDPSLRGTAWHIWNGVTATADWRSGGSTVDHAAVFGFRAREKSKAFAVAMELASQN